MEVKYSDIEELIKDLFWYKHKKEAGYPTIWLDLQIMGYIISKNKVYGIMKKNGLYAEKKKPRRDKVLDTKAQRVVDNQMNQDFRTTRPYEKAGTDVTVFINSFGKLYVSPVIDFHTGEVLACDIARNPDYAQTKRMLDELKRKHGSNIVGMMLQSDQGYQYTSYEFGKDLRDLGIIQSMSRRGNCLDNAATETFFARLKKGILSKKEYLYSSYEELEKAILKWIRYYNYHRPKMKLKMAPSIYRENYQKSLNS